MISDYSATLNQPSVSSSPDISDEPTRKKPCIETFNSAMKDLAFTDKSHHQQAFDLFFVESPLECEAVLAHENQQGHELVYVNSREALESTHLVRDFHVDEHGQFQKQLGRMLRHDPSEAPLTVVLNLSEASSDDIAHFNDLLEPDQPHLNGEPLGKHVKIVVLISQQQLQSDHQNAADGSFWRRVNRPSNSWQLSSTDTLTSLKNAKRAATKDIVISLHEAASWQQALYGTVGLNDQGAIRFMPSALMSLQPNQAVILKGAPWHDLAFKQAVQQLQQQQGFWANGQWQTLPNGVTFSQSSLDDNDHQQLLAGIQWQDSAALDSNSVLITPNTLFTVLSPLVINQQGEMQRSELLSQLLQQNKTLVLNSALSTDLWYRLLSAIQQQRQGGKTVNIALGYRCRVAPFMSALPMAMSDFKTTSHTQHRYFHNMDDQRQWLEDNAKDALVITVHAKTSLNELCEQLEILSECRHQFAKQGKPALAAMQQGRHLVLLGLESNSNLQGALESLLMPTPHLFLNGEYFEFPNLQLTTLWPTGMSAMGGPLFNQQLKNSRPCPIADPWRAVTDPVIRSKWEALYRAFDTPQFTAWSLPVANRHFLQQWQDTASALQHDDGDTSTKIPLCYWGRALRQMGLQYLRTDAERWCFAKLVTEHHFPKPSSIAEKKWVDSHQLETLLTSINWYADEGVEPLMWQLASCFDPRWFGDAASLTFDTPPDHLIALLWHCSPNEETRAILAAKYPDRIQQSIVTDRYTPLNHLRIKQLKDALAAGWTLKERPLKVTLSSHLLTLSQQCEALTTTDDVQQWVHKTLQPPLHETEAVEQLTDALIQHQRKPSHYQQKRLRQLQQRLQLTPLLFIQGGTGSGKSFNSFAVAKTMGQVFSLTAGPTLEPNHIVEGMQWQTQSDGDRTLRPQPKLIRQWAEATPQPGELVTLIVDEINLAQPWCQQLFSHYPRLLIDGQPTTLSAAHRVIFTGNPNHYGGRHLTDELAEQLICTHYPALTPAFLRDCVAEPALQFLPSAQREPILALFLQLWTLYQRFAPNHPFTPRDVTDVCSWLHFFVQQEEQTQVDTQIVQRHLYHAFRQVLGQSTVQPLASVLPYMEQFLQHRWPQAQHSRSDQLQEQLYDQFLLHVQSQPPEQRFDASGAAVRSLAQGLLLDLQRSQQAWQTQQRHHGRQMTVIEGPAGRGKDRTLQLCIESFQKAHRSTPTVATISGCAPWADISDAIKTAARHGQWLLISEMNLLETSVLEGELNDLLCGFEASQPVAPAFHIFATINPVQYGGRKGFSDALRARTNYRVISRYSEEELTNIAKSAMLTANDEQARTMAAVHCRLRETLEQKQINLLPNSRELQQWATEGGTEAAFNRIYKLHLVGADSTLETLISQPAVKPITYPFKGEASLSFSTALKDKEHFWSLNAGPLAMTNPEQYSMTVSETDIVAGATQQWATMHLQALDALISADKQHSLSVGLYRLLQKAWLDKILKQNSDPFLPKMPSNIEETLKLSINTAIIEKSYQLTEQMNTSLPSALRAWHKIQNVMNRPMPHNSVDNRVLMTVNDEQIEPSTQKTSVEIAEQPSRGTQNRPVPHNSVNNRVMTTANDEQIEPLTQKTSVEIAEEASKIEDILDTEISKSAYHGVEKHIQGCYKDMSMDSMAATSVHRVTLIGIKEVGIGEKGINYLQRPLWKDTVTLGEIRGTKRFSVSKEWQVIPLPASHQRLTALRVRQECDYKLHQDCYTQLIYIHFIRDDIDEVTVDWIAAPHRPNQISNGVKYDARIKKALDALFNQLKIKNNINNKERALLTIFNEKNIDDKINAIINYGKQFTYTEQTFTGNQEDFFVFLLRNQLGTCQHRTHAVTALLNYFNIEAFYCTSGYHAFCRYLYGQWNTVNLGGYARGTTYIYHQPDLPINNSFINDLSINNLTINISPIHTFHTLITKSQEKSQKELYKQELDDWCASFSLLLSSNSEHEFDDKIISLVGDFYVPLSDKYTAYDNRQLMNVLNLLKKFRDQLSVKTVRKEKLTKFRHNIDLLVNYGWNSIVLKNKTKAQPSEIHLLINGLIESKIYNQKKEANPDSISRNFTTILNLINSKNTDLQYHGNRLLTQWIKHYLDFDSALSEIKSKRISAQCSPVPFKPSQQLNQIMMRKGLITRWSEQLNSGAVCDIPRLMRGQPAYQELLVSNNIATTFCFGIDLIKGQIIANKNFQAMMYDQIREHGSVIFFFLGSDFTLPFAKVLNSSEDFTNLCYDLNKNSIELYNCTKPKEYLLILEHIRKLYPQITFMNLDIQTSGRLFAEYEIIHNKNEQAALFNLLFEILSEMNPRDSIRILLDTTAGMMFFEHHHPEPVRHFTLRQHMVQSYLRSCSPLLPPPDKSEKFKDKDMTIEKIIQLCIPNFSGMTKSKRNEMLLEFMRKSDINLIKPFILEQIDPELKEKALEKIRKKRY